MGSKNFTQSTQYSKVEGFAGANELELLEQNPSASRQEIYNTIRRFSNFDYDLMKNFTYEMYQKSYTSMKEGCFFIEKDESGSEVQTQITVQGMHDIMDQTDRMIYWIKIPKITLQVLVAICIFEFFMVFMHRSEALSKNAFDKIMIYRRVLGFLFIFFIWFCFRGIYTWDAHA